jgi:hypothetical protein
LTAAGRKAFAAGGPQEIPPPSQLQKKYEDRLNGSVPQKPAQESEKERKPKEHDFFKVYDMFLKECGEKNAWTEATLTEFVAYMRDSKKLRTPRKKKGEKGGCPTSTLWILSRRVK